MSVNIKENPGDFIIFDFFWSQFSLLTPPPSQSQMQDPRICNIVSLSNIFENSKLNVGQRHNITNSRILQLRWEGNWATKIAVEKIKPQLKKSKFCHFDFFCRDFCYSTLLAPPPSIAIIAGSSNSPYWVFVKHFENLPITIAGPSKT